MVVLSFWLGKQIGDCVIWRTFDNWRGLNVKQAIRYSHQFQTYLCKNIGKTNKINFLWLRLLFCTKCNWIQLYNDDQKSVLCACCAVTNNFNEQFTLSMQSSPWANSGCMTLTIASNPKPRGCTHQHFRVHHFYFSIDTIMRIPWNHFLSLRIYLHNTHNIFNISLIFPQIEHQ